MFVPIQCAGEYWGLIDKVGGDGASVEEGARYR